MRKPKIQGATRRGSDNDGDNEDYFRIFHDFDCAVVLDGASRAGSIAKRIALQFERLLRENPPASLPEWTRIVKVLDSYAMGSARTTFVGFRILSSNSGLVTLAVTVGDSKLALCQDGRVVFVSDSTKRFLGTGEAEPVAALLRPNPGDLLIAATDGAWNALGGAPGILRASGSTPVEALERPKVLLDDATLVTAQF
jgi:hypothetical protein